MYYHLFFLAVVLLIVSRTTASSDLRGSLVLGHEVRTLQPCAESKSYWLNLPTSLRRELEVSYRRIVSRPYEPVYAELQGEILDQPAEGGFAAGYDGVIDVEAASVVSAWAKGACGESLAGLKPEPTQQPVTYVFECDSGPAYTVRTTHETAWVFGPDGTLQLAAGESAGTWGNEKSRIRIEDQQFWISGTDVATRSCRNNRKLAIWEHAKLNGADYRATGNEPGWNLEIVAGERIVFVGDYGKVRLELPLPEPVVDGEKRTSRWDTGELVLEVTGRPCTDSMSGDAFESRARVWWQGRQFDGCGRALH